MKLILSVLMMTLVLSQAAKAQTQSDAGSAKTFKDRMLKIIYDTDDRCKMEVLFTSPENASLTDHLRFYIDGLMVSEWKSVGYWREPDFVRELISLSPGEVVHYETASDNGNFKHFPGFKLQRFKLAAMRLCLAVTEGKNFEVPKDYIGVFPDIAENNDDQKSGSSSSSSGSSSVGNGTSGSASRDQAGWFNYQCTGAGRSSIVYASSEGEALSQFCGGIGGVYQNCNRSYFVCTRR